MAKLPEDVLEVDLLDEDPPLSGQTFCCLSFVSPDKIIKEKNIYLFEHFVKQYNFIKTAELMTKFTNYISYKYDINLEELTEDLKAFDQQEKDDMRQSVEDDYTIFLNENKDKLCQKFDEEHSFQTSVRGLKVRGTFGSQKEAELRSKVLRQRDPNHNIFIGAVGSWMPWDPEPDEVKDVNYAQKELNELMHHKKQNELTAEQEFNARVKKSKTDNVENNFKLAEQHGNKLTQTINEKGELVSIESAMSSVEKSAGVNATMDDIKRELFEGENIVTGQTDHGLSEIMDRLKTNDDETNEKDNMNNVD